MTAGDAGQFPGFTVSSVGALSLRFDGLTLQGNYSGVGLLDEPQAASNLAKQVETLTGGVAVKIESGYATIPADSRTADTEPYYAGGQMRSGSSICSSGFAVHVNGADWTTTAEHCTETPWMNFTGLGNPYGTFGTISQIGALAVFKSHGAPRAFAAAWNDTTGYTLRVVGTYNAGLNQQVCDSGGNSGTHCSIIITDGAVKTNLGQGDRQFIGGITKDASVAVIQGDSGGAVLTPNANGDPGAIFAVGMIQALYGATQSNCGSVRYAGSNQCSDGVLFSWMATALRGLPAGSYVTTG